MRLCMGRSIQHTLHHLMLWTFIVCGLFFGFQGLADNKTIDTPFLVSLLERNSIERKILDVRYSLNVTIKEKGETKLIKQQTHLVFNSNNRMFRQETKHYGSADRDHTLYVTMWDGKEELTWARVATLETGVYEDAGNATIKPKIHRTFRILFHFIIHFITLSRLYK